MNNQTRKDQIIITAAKLFKQKGYSAVTMRDLAKAMGIKAASLYNHINSKQEILKIIIINLAETFTNEMNTIKALDISSLEKLNKIVALHVKLASKKTDQMGALNNDWMHLEEQLEYYLTLRKGYEENFRAIIKEGILNQELKDENVEVILFSMLSTLRSLYLWIPKKDGLSGSDLSSNLSKILIEGINK